MSLFRHNDFSYSISPHALRLNRYRLDARLKRLEEKCTRLAFESAEASEDAGCFLANIGVMRVYAHDARMMRPSLRMTDWASGLVAQSETAWTAEAIRQALRDLDEREMLRSEEIRMAPAVIRFQAVQAFASCGERVLTAQKARLSAEAWLSSHTPVPFDASSPAFFAHALHLAAEADDTKKRETLSERMKLIGRSEEECIRIAQDEESRLVVRMEALTALCRQMDCVDWEEVFHSVSFTEQVLMSDPAGIYPDMDEASMHVIETELAVIARRVGCTERITASLAVALADNENGVCGVLYTDEGRKQLLSALNAKNVRLPRIVPDPSGVRLFLYKLFAFCIIAVPAFFILPKPLSVLAAIPALYMLSEKLVQVILTRIYPARPLLRLDESTVPPEHATLVVIPALLSSPSRAEALAGQLEALGALDENQHVEYLLLGDFSDAANEHCDGDEAIVNTVRTHIARMNASAKRDKYHYLHRSRVLNHADERYMGHERKRGALEDLNRLLVTGENRFQAEGTCAQVLYGRFRYVLTVDADTEMLPNSIQKLIGTLAHPLNRAYNVIQPRMEFAGDLIGNRFARLFAGAGGSDTYHCCAHHLYQDFCGQGTYNGKGIYRIQEFFMKTQSAFDENTLLSHDLMEGLLVGSGYAGDISLFEGFPSTPSSYLKRQERWTRGDWQLLRYFFGKVPLTLIGRMRIAENLLVSLFEPSVMALLVLAVWYGSAGSALIGLSALFLPCFLARFRGLRPALGRFLLLPSLAVVQQGAIGRALFRMAISHRKMLEWITAADADELTGGRNTAGIAQTILLVPALLRPAWIPFALVMAAAFVFGREMLERLARDKAEVHFRLGEFAMLMGVARDTWKYFEHFVPLSGNGLPPDNVQLEPNRGAAMRTSPTNIGLYMASCVAARELGLIDALEMRERLNTCAKTLEKLEKWKGLLYNWYDTRTLRPLYPRYVSSVDCGNLLACLLLCRNSVEDSETVDRLNSLIKEMDFSALYDPSRHLFRIGYDAERDLLAASYYDLLASEARILSFTAISEKKIPLRHWESLGRPCVRVSGGSALMSWSGTMFEYMMPFLFMPSAPSSLLGVSARGIVQAQLRYATRRGRVWGVSECAYRAFDADLNYQYRAFGVPELALSGVSEGNTVAPYASCLALAAEPALAVKNISALLSAGMGGEYGMYEAMDYGDDDTPETVFCFMSHHQGMALCALCNALTDNALSRRFMSAPRQRALTVLLNEKPFARPRLFAERTKRQAFGDEDDRLVVRRRASNLSSGVSDGSLRGHLLTGGGSTAFLMSDGSGCLVRDGVYANLWHGDVHRYSEKLLPDVTDESGPVAFDRIFFDAGSALWQGKSPYARYEIAACISPESGALLFRVRTDADEAASVHASFRQAFEVALTDEESMHAHPVFHDLFVSSSAHSSSARCFRRKKRDESDTSLCLIHSAYGGTLLENEPPSPIRGPLTAAREGERPLKQCAVRHMETVLPAAQRKTVFFSILLADAQEADNLPALNDAAFERALSLARASGRSLIGFCGLNASSYRAAERWAVNIFCPCAEIVSAPNVHVNGRELWRFGISGEKPLITVLVSSPRQTERLKRALKMHRYFLSAGVRLSLVIVYPSSGEYSQPLLDRLEAVLGASHLSHMRSCEGGAYILEENTLTESEKRLLSLLDISGPHTSPETYAPNKTLTVDSVLPPVERLGFNGFGGFSADGLAYEIDLYPDRDTPAPWINVLSNPCFGALVTERGGGFIWFENSRLKRITPFDNDPLREGWCIRLYADGVPLIPTESPRGAYRIRHSAGETMFSCTFSETVWHVRWHVDNLLPVLCLTIQADCSGGSEKHFTVEAIVDWLMGVDTRDRRFTQIYAMNGICYARGKTDGVAFMAVAGDEVSVSAAQNHLRFSADIPSGGVHEQAIIVGAAQDEASARQLAHSFHAESSYIQMRRCWDERLSKVQIDVGNTVLNGMLNRFIKYQVLACRVFARTGFSQPGGAIGLRDQLQDMLVVLYMDPAIVRAHLLDCAAHQFRDGDGMHWWHAPFLGVRTRISDDMLFLPFVCAQYVSVTGDRSILSQNVPFLENVDIPLGKSDLYGEYVPSDDIGTVHEHCMRAFRRADSVGAHCLAKMGGGDWNDGMNRVGGESVWLSEFLSFTAFKYSTLCDGEDRAYLLSLSERMKSAVETSGWDGEWYLRAIDESGRSLGGSACSECRIDLISQAWAALNRQPEDRVRQALASVEKHLVDEEAGLVRLLAPPFTGASPNPGYISAYPAGVRENGGQYTHAVCWLAAAYARMGDAEKAWRTFDMLLPLTRTDSSEKARLYRGEPYAIAADISSQPPACGIAGWTWYTGAAAWTFKVMLEEILGLSIQNGRASLCALLPAHLREVSVTVRVGKSVYILKSGTFDDAVTDVMLTDDGGTHEVHFHARKQG